MKDFFTVTSVHRDDLKSIDPGTDKPYLEDTDKVTDGEMAGLADKIQEAIMDSGVFWEAVRQWIEDYKESKEK